MADTKRRQKGRRRRRQPDQGPRRSIIWRWRRGLFLVGLLLVAGVAGVGYVLSRVELPPEQVQAQTSFICAADVATGCNETNAIARLHAEQDRVNVRLEQIPPVMVNAVLAAEDKDFFKHGGVDPFGIIRAAWADVRNRGARQGGSTITQQYVKNVYLTKERTISRKIKEAVLAVKVEQKFSKRDILERYLNTIYFGRGAYGVGAAASTYFGKPVEALSLPEASYLAGLIRSPESADAVRDPDAASQRRQRVLDAMVEEKYVTADEAAAAAAVPWVVGQTVLPRSAQEGFGPVVGSTFGTKYFVDYVHRQLLAKGFTDAEIYAGGLRIYTTIDLNLQHAGFDAVGNTLDQEDDPNAALVAIDEKGQIKAMVGGRDFETDKVNKAVGTEGGGSGRQAGSAMKPFVLAAAVKQGISVDSKFNAPGELKIPKANAGKTWTVHNYGNEEFDVLSLIEATRSSVNTVYAQLMVKVKPENVVPLAQRMGITSPLQPVNALVLGSESVSPLEMASAYSTFADGGVHVQPTAILRVERANGSVIGFDQPQEQVFTPQENDIITYCLRQVVTAGTGKGASFGKPVAGKTGTTQDNNDAWFVGYTPNGLTTAVWMGYDPTVNADGSLEPRYMNDVHGKAVTGGSYPATIWRNFMEHWTDGMDVGSFHTPRSFPGVVLNAELTTTSSTEDTTTTTTLPPATTLPPVTVPPTTGAPPTTEDSSTTTATGPPITVG